MLWQSRPENSRADRSLVDLPEGSVQPCYDCDPPDPAESPNEREPYRGGTVFVPRQCHNLSYSAAKTVIGGHNATVAIPTDRVCPLLL